MPALIERPKMTKTMYQALKRHILRERDKKKLELEQDAEYERIKKEREQKKKKEQEDSLTLEQTKEQINQLDKKLESLKEEKHQLFSELKKVLHQEDETRRRAQMKEHNELASMGQQPSYMTGSPHPMFLQTAGHMPAGRPTMFKPAHHMLQTVTGIKRPRSPSPPPSASMYHQYPDNKYPNYAPAKQGAYPPSSKHNYQQTTSGHVYPVSQSGHTYQPQSSTYSASQSASSKYPSGQSAFSSYGHYTTSKQLAEHYSPAGYARLQQPGYMGGHGSGLPLQQQLEHASQKSGFSEDKYKLQQSALRGMAGMTPQQQALQQVHAAAAQQAQAAQAAQPKPSMVPGYPVRTQAQSSSSYQSPHAYSSQQNGSQRHSYPQQRFF